MSRNEHKIREATEILGPGGVSVIAVHRAIDEIQTEDTERLVRDKVLKAYSAIGRPLFVEHTGLYLDHLNGLPGGLTQVFWDALQADRFAELFGRGSNTDVLAKTVVGYTDGRKILLFEGEIPGSIAPEPRGGRDFQWDCVFVPDGYDLTFSELGEKKNEISMRRRALDSLREFLQRRVRQCKD